MHLFGLLYLGSLGEIVLVALLVNVDLVERVVGLGLNWLHELLEGESELLVRLVWVFVSVLHIKI
jgi:hypothetical protein